MVRVKRGIISKKSHKKILKKASGYYGSRSRVFRVAKQAVIRASQYSYRDRKQKKREFRKLWILRINAASRSLGLSYSVFIYRLKKLNICINRKFLFNLALFDKNVFNEIFNKVKNFN